MKKLLFAFLCVLFVSGCSKEAETKTAYCTGNRTNAELGYLESQRYDFEYEDDKVTKQTIKIETTFTDEAYLEDGKISKDTKALLDQQVQLVQNVIKDSKGVKYTVEYENATVKEVYAIDYEFATNTELVSIGLLNASDSEADFISMAKTITNLENAGLTCTK